MPSFTGFGKSTKTTFLNQILQKLNLSFKVGASTHIYPGMPVKLDVNGFIVPHLKTDSGDLNIGYAIFEGTDGQNVTVIMRSDAVIWALSNAAANAGPVAITSYDTTNNPGNADLMGYNRVEAAAANTMVGWMLDKPTAGNQLVRVALRD